MSHFVRNVSVAEHPGDIWSCDGDVGACDSNIGLCEGDVRVYDGDVGLHDGDVGLYDGDTGQYNGDVGNGGFRKEGVVSVSCGNLGVLRQEIDSLLHDPTL